MLDLAKMDVALPVVATGDDVTIGALLAACDQLPATPLVFSYQGQRVKPGYHVTEVKAGRFGALDCGGNPETWSEIFIQLWDVMDGDCTHMPAGKFAAIIRKVSDHLALDLSAKLTFEVSDGIGPMQLHAAGSPEEIDDVLHVALAPRAASCKPRDRWLEEQKKASSCCGSGNAAKPCC